MNDTAHFLFFSDDWSDSTVKLDREEFHHARSVVRCDATIPLRVTDGRGTIATCMPGTFDKDGCVCTIVDKKELAPNERAPVLIVGLPDKESFEIAVTSATALGAGRIAPAICTLCRDRWWEKRWDLHAMRLRRKMIASVKQSGNPWLPQLDAPMSFSGCLDSQSSGPILVADPDGAAFKGIHIECKSGERIKCVVGPPGGFSPEELVYLDQLKAQKLQLGPWRLRTELAATLITGLVAAHGGM